MSQSPFGGKVIGRGKRRMIEEFIDVAIAFRREGDWKLSHTLGKPLAVKSQSPFGGKVIGSPMSDATLILGGAQSPFGGKVIGSKGFGISDALDAVAIAFRREGDWKEYNIPFIMSSCVAIAFRREGDWKGLQPRTFCKIASRNRLSAGR